MRKNDPRWWLNDNMRQWRCWHRGAAGALQAEQGYTARIQILERSHGGTRSAAERRCGVTNVTMLAIAVVVNTLSLSALIFKLKEERSSRRAVEAHLIKAIASLRADLNRLEARNV